MENNVENTGMFKNLHLTKLINGHTIEAKEYNGKRVITFKDIDEVHERKSGTARKRFNDNKQWFVEGEDYFVIELTASEKRTQFGAGKNAGRELTLVTESGYLMIIKSFHDDLSWQLQRILVNSYFKAKEMQSENYDDLSPMLRMFIQQERQMKAMQTEIADTKAQLEITQTENQKHNERLNTIDGKINAVSDAIKLDSTSWRKEVSSVIRKICRNANDAYPTVGILYGEIYKVLELRAKCNLTTRLTHKQVRMRDAGVCMSKVKQVNRLDIIAEDAQLTEIFIAIVREYAIKFGIRCNLNQNQTENSVAKSVVDTDGMEIAHDSAMAGDVKAI